MNNKNVESNFLQQARKAGEQVTVFLMNGFQMRGVITDSDDSCIILTIDGKQNMILRHAISTIQPLHNLELGPTNN